MLISSLNADNRPQVNQNPSRAPRAQSRDRYIFKDLIGEGGNGRVYRVHDRAMGCDVAAKMLSGVEPEDIYRLKREFRLVSGVAHPNLVELYDLVIDGAQCFFTMELVSGVDFLQHVRGDADRTRPLDDQTFTRFRESLGQLASALATLHAAGYLHCDIKPANVLVTTEGRVVLLDFGLVRSLRGGGRPDEPGFAGTIDYMAPEQAWGGELSPATDAYSVGAMLYETLTGRVPFEGPPARTLVARSQAAPSRTTTHVPSIPEDMDKLIIELLDPKPARRPGINALMRYRSAGSTRHVTSNGPTPFIGRADTLARLQELAVSVVAKPVIAEVKGPSGIGKTTLLREFTYRLEDDGAIVLRGRCHPQESVPYQALDGVLDDLTRALAMFDSETVTTLVPEHAQELARLFPVLRRLPEWYDIPEIGLSDLAAPELRRRAIVALRFVLMRLAEQGRLVIWLDDVQWGDEDSISLLSDVLRRAGAPRLLLLLSFRSGETRMDEFLSPLRRGHGLTHIAVHEITVAPLATVEVQQLALARFRERASVYDECIATIIAEAQGIPFIAGEIASWLATGISRAAPDLQLIIAERLASLPQSARTLLEVIAVAGRPLPRRIALEAAGVVNNPVVTIQQLRIEQLLRDEPSASGATLELAHDRIREAVLQALSTELRRNYHQALANALLAHPDVEPDALLDHLLGAGQHDAAREAALANAQRAEESLAWSRAARCLRKALELGAKQSSDAWKVWRRLGVCLSGAGRAVDAAEAYRQAAQVLESTSPNHVEIVALRRSAAEQHLRGGDMETGVALLQAVLVANGVAWPKSALGAVGTIAGARLQLAIEERFSSPATAPTATQVRELDAYWSACLGLNMTDFLRSAAFQARHAVLARRTTDARHLTRAVSTDVAYRACEGGSANRAAAEQLKTKAAKHAAEAGDPESPAFVVLCAGVAAYYNGRFRQALQHIDDVEPVFTNLHDGITWEIGNCWMYRAWALGWLGEMDELCRILPEAIARAQSQGNRLALAGLAGAHAGLAWLAADQPEEGRSLANEAISPFPKGSFQSPHYAHALTVARIELYQEKPLQALQIVDAAWPRLRANQMLRMQMFRVELTHLRASVLLAAAATETKMREKRLSRVASAAKLLVGEDHPCSAALASLLHAGILSVQGDRAAARAAFQAAGRICDDAGLGLFSAAARIRSGDEAGASWMREQGVMRPERVTQTLAPG